jgi:OmpA-OmpF porin, OOP family
VTTNGCPPLTDRDNDGVLDAEDACPTQVGVRSKDPKMNGCPGANVAKGSIEFTERIKFTAFSADVSKDDDEILSRIAKILIEHPEIKWTRVEGHADGFGEAQRGKALSSKRAEAVVNRLGELGVSLDRLMSQGFGSSRPIDSNDTEAGRKNNRRVEFRIGETGKK